MDAAFTGMIVAGLAVPLLYSTLSAHPLAIGRKRARIDSVGHMS